MGEKVRRVSVCGHLFHSGCLMVWLYSKEKCPICDHALDKETLDKHDMMVNDSLRESRIHSDHPSFSVNTNDTIKESAVKLQLKEKPEIQSICKNNTCIFEGKLGKKDLNLPVIKEESFKL